MLQSIFSETPDVPVHGYKLRRWQWEKKVPVPENMSGGDKEFTAYVDLRVWMNPEGRVHGVILDQGWRHRGYREKAEYSHAMIPPAYFSAELAEEVRVAIREAATELAAVMENDAKLAAKGAA